MASGPYPDHRRGTWSVQYHDGRRWRRVTVVRKRPGWTPGDGMPKRPPREAIEALARLARVEDEARRNRTADPGRTIRGFLADYRAEYERTRAARSLVELDKAIASFVAFCDRAKARLLSDADAALCRAWIADRASQTSRKTGKPISHKRLSLEKALLAAAWSRAVRRDEVPTNPWIKVDVPAKPERKRRGSWTPEQFAAISAEARPWLRDVVTLGVQTGLRITALTSVRWEHVEWPAGPEQGLGHLRVPAELDKVGVGYSVPLSRDAHDLLQRRLMTGGDDGGPILRGPSGTAVKPAVVSRAIVAACRRAGLPNPDSPNHHMRRTFGRWAHFGQLTGRPVPIYVVSRWLGHSNVRTTQVYLDIDPHTSAEWMTDVSELPAKGTPPRANGPE